jgi:NUMOD4 motif/HNH endonuclease
MSELMKNRNLLKSYEDENWKKIIGFEKLYEVSDYGRIKSLGRITIKSNGVKQVLKPLILKPGEGKLGHQNVNLHKDGIALRVNVARLVAQYFIPNPKNFPIVEHIDDNPRNNYYGNLMWSTYSSNNAKSGKKYLGEKNSQSKITNEIALAIKNSKLSYSKLCKIYNVSEGCISGIKQGKTWKHI